MTNRHLPLSLFVLVALSLLMSACANYQLNYSPKAAKWEADVPPAPDSVAHRVFLIGGTGGSDRSALALLGDKLKQAGPESSVLFLGDNLSTSGLAPADDLQRQSGEQQLSALLEILEGYPGRIHFIAGDQDWQEYGLKGLARQQAFIEARLGREDVFLPKPGCGDPEVIEVSEHLVILLIDAQWYLTDWRKDHNINTDCDIKSREFFADELADEIKKHRSKNVLIAMHHPPYTMGPYGGQFTIKQHLFPLTDLRPNLYLPLPVAGSVFQFLRGNVGNEQHAIHPRYQELSDLVVNAARTYGRFVFASGHERSLQYMEKDNQAFIVSGAGSESTAVNARDGGQFAYGHRGFAELSYYPDGSAWVQFWVPEEGRPEGRLVFRKQASPPLVKAVAQPPKTFPPIPDSVTVPVSQNDFERGPLWSFLWGEHYRAAYNAVITLPALNLDEYRGGVYPVKRGGGGQTNSLRLEGRDGRQYALRSIDKDATRTLGYPFNESFMTALLEDNFSAAHPFGAIACSALAKAAGIYYTQNEMYYLPPQPALGIYNDDYAGALYTIEERPDDEVWNDYAQFGKPKRINSTSKTRKKLIAKHDEDIDYQWVVRNRLFDVLIGDWDRHDDQWRWSEIDGEVDYYRPIPRDRDQAFSKYDGLLLSLARGTSPDIKKLKVFGGDVKRINWLTYNGRYFDRTFLSGADWAMWESEARRLQARMTDEVIDRAFSEHWPAPLYELDGREIAALLKARRDGFMDIARGYYELQAESVDVIGTDKRDLFLVERLEEGRTRVRVYDTNSKSEKEFKYYDRTFLASETQEVILYGLGSQDVFRVRGNCGGKCVKVRMIGGAGQDILEDESDGRRLIYYDDKGEGDLLQTGHKAKVRLKKDPVFNTYDHQSADYDFNYSSLVPFGGFNPDDGVLLGLAGRRTTFGFKKAPHASQHTLTAFYALATGGIVADYKGEFIDVLGKLELGLDAHLQTPLYSNNFYGLGNESVNIENQLDDERLTYNRVRIQRIHFMPSLMYRLNANSRVLAGPTFESINVARTSGRFIDDIGDELPAAIFDGIEFAGVRALVEYKATDHAALPSRGLDFFLEGGWKQQLNKEGKHYAYLDTELSLYQRIDRQGKLVLATRFGFQHRFSEDYEFYQGASLSGPGPDANFRGFRRNRFVGSTAFYQNTDLRLKLLSSANPTLPFSFGTSLGFDHGRVWLRGEDSDVWHYSYGLGVWISPFDIMVFSGGVYRGDNKNNRVVVSGGFFF